MPLNSSDPRILPRFNKPYYDYYKKFFRKEGRPDFLKKKGPDQGGTIGIQLPHGLLSS